MRNSCLCRPDGGRDVVYRIAYQLTVTRHGKTPDRELIRQLSGKQAIQGSRAENAVK
jgi:hypothetical protein